MRQGNYIVGIGGLNVNPYAAPDAHAVRVGRVRRLYVMQDCRRQGVGRRLVHQIIQEAQLSFDWLQVRTTHPVAAQFYQALGFTPCNSELVTHLLNLASTEFPLE